MQCRLPTDHDLRQWWRWSSITSTAASWKHHGDIYNIACTIYIETMQLKPIYMSNSMNVFKDRSVCFSSSYMYISYKLPFNLNAFKSILNIIEVVGFFTFRSGLWKPQFEIFIITLCRKLFQYNDRHVGGGLTHSETKEKNNNWEMSFSRGFPERCNIDDLLLVLY